MKARKKKIILKKLAKNAIRIARMRIQKAGKHRTKNLLRQVTFSVLMAYGVPAEEACRGVEIAMRLR